MLFPEESHYHHLPMDILPQSPLSVSHPPKIKTFAAITHSILLKSLLSKTPALRPIEETHIHSLEMYNLPLAI